MAKSFQMFTWYMQLCKRYYGEDYQWRALQEGGNTYINSAREANDVWLPINCKLSVV